MLSNSPDCQRFFLFISLGKFNLRFICNSSTFLSADLLPSGLNML